LTTPGVSQPGNVSSGSVGSGNLPGNLSGSGVGTRGDAAGQPTAVGGTAPSDDTTTLPPPGTSGRGFTATEIRIGYLTWNDVSRAGAVGGFANANYGDQEGVAKAIANDINKHGGIAGRKVVVVFHDYSTNDVLVNGQEGDQKACTHLTEDNPVFAVVGVTGIMTDVLPACLKQHRTPLIADTANTYARSIYTKYFPYFVDTASPMLEQFLPAWISSADRLRYFSPWDTTRGQPGKLPVKIGILTSDNEYGTLFDRIVRQQLAKTGRTATTTFKLGNPLDASQVSSAVLRFKSQGVTHVIPDGLMLLLFPQGAESQQYRPRYLLSTAEAPSFMEANTPPAQFNGAIGSGWGPGHDVDTHNAPPDISPAETHCRAVMRNAGLDVTNRNAYSLMTLACDGFEMLRRTLPSSPSPERLWPRVKAMRTMPAAGTFALDFAGDLPTGVHALRDLAYKRSCSCFYYMNNINRPF
jgi:hypothetical protein